MAEEVQVEAYYRRFSAQVGLRDWLLPNPRHEQLKLILEDLLRGRTGLSILDLGCGAGVMSDFLTRHGQVTALDFSAPAVRLARLMAPRVDFGVGDLLALPQGAEFDLVTLFDVIEHVAPDDRAALFGGLRTVLRPRGGVILSTPHPSYTRWLQRERPDLLQVIDEPVEQEHVLRLATAIGLELRRYEAFDVESGGPQYQVFELSTPSGEALPPHRRPLLERRLRTRANPIARVLRRVRLGGRLMAGGRIRLGAWFVLGRGRPPKELTDPSEDS